MSPVTQEQVTNENMSTQELSQRLSGNNQPTTQTSAGMETVGETTARARQMVQPTVDAGDLASGTRGVTVPEPQQGNIPAGPLNVARNVARNTQGFIEAQTAEQNRLRELQETFGGLGEQDSLSEVFQQQREQFGATPEAIQELQDIQLRLSDMDTESALTQTRIQGAAGQTMGQAQREVTQEQREAAVRSAGLAARASVLQGNIETARQLANDAVDIEFQDRQLNAQNLLQQIDMVQGQVDNQTEQLLEQEKRQYEQELATIQEVKDNVANAMVNGATQQEIAQLTSDQVSDQEKIALAQQITARGAGEMRDLEMEQASASAAASRASAGAAQQLANQRRVETLITRAEGGDESAITELGYDPRETTADIIVPEQYQNTVNQAATLAGAGDKREATKAIIGQALANEDYTQAYSQIANNVEDSLTGTVKSRFSNARTDIGVMTDMRDAVEDYVAAGGNTGFLKGKAQDITERFGQLANSKDPEFAALGARLQREFQTYRNIMTGAAFTPEESAEYAAVNPTEDKSLNLNLAVIDGALDQLESRVVNTVETRATGSTEIYEKAITGGADTTEASWDEVGSMSVGEQFTIGGTLYEKAGEDNYTEVK